MNLVDDYHLGQQVGWTDCLEWMEERCTEHPIEDKHFIYSDCGFYFLKHKDCSYCWDEIKGKYGN